MPKKSSVEVADRITDRVFLTVWRQLAMEKFSSVYFLLFVCFFKYALSQGLVFFYCGKKVAFFSYIAVCLLAFLICCSHGFLLFCGKQRIPQCIASVSTLCTSNTTWTASRAPQQRAEIELILTTCRKRLSATASQVLRSAVLLSLMW